MAILINMKPQRPVETVDAASQPIPCGLAKVQRTTAGGPRRPRRVVACPAKPAPNTTGVLRSEDIALWLPPTGRSAYHRRLELDARTSMQQLLAQHAISENMRKTDTGNGNGNGNGTTTPDGIAFDPRLNDLAFSLLADAAPILAHLVDRVEVSADSVLYEKLQGKTLPFIRKLAPRLKEYGLDDALAYLAKAVDEQPFVDFIQHGESTAPAVYDRIELCVGLMLMTMLEIARHAPDRAPGDWPPAEAPGVAVGEPVPGKVEVVRAAPARNAPKRARRVARPAQPPRRKR